MGRFLPVCREDVEERNWGELDFVLVTGDAYVDHPSFGAALISRVLESQGYRIGIIAQPDWRSVESFRILGRPRLAFLITAGNLDSMVSNHSVSKHRRRRDAYAPGGVGARRPDRATIVYTACAKHAFKNVPVVLGGIEASLRRLSHYDYWSDKVRRSVLLDSKADLLVYGMGENQITEIAAQLSRAIPIGEITSVRGTAYRRSNLEGLDLSECEMLPAFERIREDRRAFAESFLVQSDNADPFTAKTLVEPCGSSYVVQNPPALPIVSKQLDVVYELPYTRDAHPMYQAQGGVPALEEVKFSLVSSRGCFGGCSFCSLSFHQGQIVQSRTHESLLREATTLTRRADFKGYIHDVGGPTANFRRPACRKQAARGSCRDRRCLAPEPCSNLLVDHQDYRALLGKLRELQGVRKVFVRSGIRYDYLMADPDDSFLRELSEHHVSGQLKVAPEHVCEAVLESMGKPTIDVFESFCEKYSAINRELGKKQYLVPYYMTGHPGSSLSDAVRLAEYLRDRHFVPDQVQDFYPTPGTLSTCMYWSGLDPRTMEPIFVARGLHEKALQRALAHFRDPNNYELVREALMTAGRSDLIGYSQKCLIRPERHRRRSENGSVEETVRDRKQVPRLRGVQVQRPDDRRRRGDETETVRRLPPRLPGDGHRTRRPEGPHSNRGNRR